MAISLSKGNKINLQKNTPAGLGEILVNLNWNSSGSESIDLDLGCLYELNNGRKGAVQALGKSFGSLTAAPFVALDGDDRTGESTDGENLRINGNMISQIKRILVYTFIYDGIANWQQADATVTIKYPQAEDIIVKMDTFNSSQKVCGLALFQNVNNETFSVEKVIKFCGALHNLDEEFGWGLKYKPGKKD